MDSNSDTPPQSPLRESVRNDGEYENEQITQQDIQGGEAEQTGDPGHAAPIEHAEATEDAEATEHAEATEDAEATELAKTTEEVEATEPAEATEEAEATEPAEATEDAEATELAKTTEEAEATEPAERAEGAETAKDRGATEHAKETEHTETAEEEGRNEALDFEHAELSKNVEGYEDFENVTKTGNGVESHKPYGVDDVPSDGLANEQDLQENASIPVGADVALSREEAKEELPPRTGSVDEVEDLIQPQDPSRGVQAVFADGPTPAELTMPPGEPGALVSVSTPLPKGYIVSSEIEVLTDATVHPMGFRVVVSVPGMPTNELSTRFLFESIAARLGCHPEALRISCCGERIRFGKTLPFEREDTKFTPQQKASVAGRLWVDVYFDDDRVPPHLESLCKDDFLVRCVQVCARPPPIYATDLVAARRRGLTYLAAEQEWRMSAPSEDVITVAILQELHGTRLPYLGGYRSKKDPSRIFLHAATQLFSPGDGTLADLQHGPLRVDGFSRQTQTWGVTRSCQTRREAKTQTGRPDYVPDETWDKVVIAKPYFTSGQLLALHKERAIVIQKMYRKWKARKIRCELAADRQAYLDHAAAQAAAEKAAREHYEEFERQRRAVPRTADDFATLRRELEAWRAAEAARVTNDASLSEAKRRAELAIITRRELELLQDIEALRRAAVVNRRTRRFETILEEMASAKECGTVNIATQAAERARELRQLYLALTQPIISTEARLDTLLHIKWTVREFDVPLTREMVELLDREADLMHRGRTAASLKGLRTRQEHLFKRFIATPEYNPAVEEVVKGPKFGSVPVEWTPAKAAAHRLKPYNVL